MSEELVECPFCAEEIKAAAIKCKHCGSMLEGIHGEQADLVSTATDKVRISLERELRPLKFLFPVWVIGVLPMLALWPHCSFVPIVLYSIAGLGVQQELSLISMTCSFCGFRQRANITRSNHRCLKCTITSIIDWIEVKRDGYRGYRWLALPIAMTLVGITLKVILLVYS